MENIQNLKVSSEKLVKYLKTINTCLLFASSQSRLAFPYTRGARCSACPKSCRNGLCGEFIVITVNDFLD